MKSLKAITSQKEFVQNWLSDLLESDAFAEEKLLTKRAFGADLEIIQSEDAYNTARKLARMEGIFGGTTSGANVWAAIQRARIIGSGRKILTIICDSGLKYLDGDLFRW
jgi:cysteine synthase